VVGSVATWGDHILLCRRAIEPCRGLWTLPAGFMEMSETTVEGAIREAWEEARARIAVDALLAVYQLPQISQVQMIYRARLLQPEIAPGPESAAVHLFAWDELPWDELAFPTVRWALRHHRDHLGRTDFAAAGNPADIDSPGPWSTRL
jgi:ADP-ribose pyrophosphatase YjhB (NUDIX family)